MVDTQCLAIGIGEADCGQQSGAGLEILVGIFRVDPRLDGMAFGRKGAEGIQCGQIAGGELDHPLHQVHTEYLFGDTMFHLQAGVHFQKIKGIGVLVENEFHGTGIAVLHRFHQCPGSVL